MENTQAGGHKKCWEDTIIQKLTSSVFNEVNYDSSHPWRTLIPMEDISNHGGHCLGWRTLRVMEDTKSDGGHE